MTGLLPTAGPVRRARLRFGARIAGPVLVFGSGTTSGSKLHVVSALDAVVDLASIWRELRQ